MIVMARESDYADILPVLTGRNVLIWTCNTCARLCDIGGRSNAESLASRLVSDGVPVVGVASSSACCFMRSSEIMARESNGEYDIVLALCCDMGARNAMAVTGAEVLNPIRTYGTGYLGIDDIPHLVSMIDGSEIDEALTDIIVRDRLHAGPF